MEILLEYMDEVGGTHSSFMAEKFHPTPGADFLPSMMRNIKWFCRKTGYTEFPSEHTPKVIRDWMEGAFEVAGIIGVTGFVRTTNKEEEKKRGAKTSGDRSAWSYGYMEETRCTSRKTCVAKFSLIPHRQWKEGKSLKHCPDRNRAIKFLSKLCGRLHVWSDPWLTAKSLPIAKTGLVSVLADRFVIEMCGSWDSFVAKYPATYALMAICCSVFSERKGAFTLESQKQGSLNPHMPLQAGSGEDRASWTEGCCTVPSYLGGLLFCECRGCNSNLPDLHGLAGLHGAFSGRAVEEGCG